MLDNLYSTLIMTANPELSLDNELDNDGVLNPGEGFSVIFTFTNNSFETDALDAVATLTIDSGGTITSDIVLNIGDIPLGETAYGEYSILLEDSIPFGDFNIHLDLSADYINNFGELANYTKEVQFSIDVSLNQAGFPISTADLRSSPLVIDLDEDGDRCATSFLIPKSEKDVKQRGASFYEWASWSAGMFGRTPDYKNASVMSFAAANAFLGKGETNFSENMVNFYNEIRKGDKVLTHTLVNPQKNFDLAKQGKFTDEVALHVVKETDTGIIVKGARLLATLGPTADEIEVFPSTLPTIFITSDLPGSGLLLSTMAMLALILLPKALALSTPPISGETQTKLFVLIFFLMSLANMGVENKLSTGMSKKP